MIQVNKESNFPVRGAPNPDPGRKSSVDAKGSEDRSSEAWDSSVRIDGLGTMSAIDRGRIKSRESRNENLDSFVEGFVVGLHSDERVHHLVQDIASNEASEHVEGIFRCLPDQPAFGQQTRHEGVQVLVASRNARALAEALSRFPCSLRTRSVSSG